MWRQEELNFYRNKKVLITGHTGFKGSWLCKVLIMAGADITGYSLEPPTDPSLFKLCHLEKQMKSIIGDIRDFDQLLQVFVEAQPEIVIHMAAQPLVIDSYKNPRYTYDVNVMGTVNVLECVRLTKSVRSFLNVTTDKVYKNKEWEWGYRENEELNGFDPYSNSKSCSELVTDSYKKSFFSDHSVAISTARAGNVIGGGDFALDRIVPDFFRAVENQTTIVLRNPLSTRPYQHVLEPLIAYLMIVKAQYEEIKASGSYNVGPYETDCWTNERLVDSLCRRWNEQNENKVIWEVQSNHGPHEANFLKLDCSKITKDIGWKPKWDMDKAISMIVEWNQRYFDGENVSECMENQIRRYVSDSLYSNGKE